MGILHALACCALAGWCILGTAYSCASKIYGNIPHWRKYFLLNFQYQYIRLYIRKNKKKKKGDSALSCDSLTQFLICGVVAGCLNPSPVTTIMLTGAGNWTPFDWCREQHYTYTGRKNSVVVNYVTPGYGGDYVIITVLTPPTATYFSRNSFWTTFRI